MLCLLLGLSLATAADATETVHWGQSGFAVDGSIEVKITTPVDKESDRVQFVISRMNAPIAGFHLKKTRDKLDAGTLCDPIDVAWQTPPVAVRELRGRMTPAKHLSTVHPYRAEQQVMVRVWDRDEADDTSFDISLPKSSLEPGSLYCVTRIDWRSGNTDPLVSKAQRLEAIKDLAAEQPVNWSEKLAAWQVRSDKQAKAGARGSSDKPIIDALDAHVRPLARHEQIQNALATWPELFDTTSLLGHPSEPIERTTHEALFMAISETLALHGVLEREGAGKNLTFHRPGVAKQGKVKAKKRGEAVDAIVLQRNPADNKWTKVGLYRWNAADPKELVVSEIIDAKLSDIKVHGTDVSLVELHAFLAGQLKIGTEIRLPNKADQAAFKVTETDISRDVARRAEVMTAIDRWVRLLEEGQRRHSTGAEGHYAALGWMWKHVATSDKLTDCKKLPQQWDLIMQGPGFVSTCTDVGSAPLGQWPGTNGVSAYSPLSALHVAMSAFDREAARWDTVLTTLTPKDVPPAAYVQSSKQLDAALTSEAFAAQYFAPTIGVGALFLDDNAGLVTVPVLGLRAFLRPNPTGDRIWRFRQDRFIQLVSFELLTKVPSFEGLNPTGEDATKWGPEDQFKGPLVMAGAALHSPGIPWLSLSVGRGFMQRTYTDLSMEDPQNQHFTYGTLSMDFMLFDAIRKRAPGQD